MNNEKKSIALAHKQAAELAQGGLIDRASLADKTLLIEQLKIIRNNCQLVIQQLKNQ